MTDKLQIWIEKRVNLKTKRGYSMPSEMATIEKKKKHNKRWMVKWRGGETGNPDIACKNVRWLSHCEKEFGVSSKSQT